MTETAQPEAQLRSWQFRVFGLLWGAYASYYLCRLNFAVAQPAILKEFPSWTGAQIGSIPSAYALAYAVGQLINGTLGQRYGARRMMTGALVVASCSNVLFALTSSFEAMRALWALNGFAQSAGWALLVQTISDWNTSARRGTLLGRLSTSYQIGHVLSWLLAGALCEVIGWRAAFLVPGLYLLPVALVVFLFLRDSPAEVGLPPVRDDVEPKPLQSAGAAVPPDSGPGWNETLRVLRLTFSNRVLWILSLSFLVMNSVRYSFMNWSVQYMSEFHERSIQVSVLTAVVIPLAGCAGAVAAGWASDVWFGKRRAPVCVLMLAGLAATSWAMAFVPAGNWPEATLLLAVAGFMIYGPDVLMAGAATVDLSHPKAAAIATGFAMGMGALGAIFSGAGIGYLKDLGHGNWSLVFRVLAAMPLVPALLLCLIWNVRPRTRRS
jgi:sugar phosphate permease